MIPDASSDKSTLTETDIRTKYITPALVKSGWDIQSQIREEYRFTDGRIIVRRGKTARGKSKFADYLLFYKSNLPLAIVEAKDNNHTLGDGMQQALDYADILHADYSDMGIAPPGPNKSAHIQELDAFWKIAEGRIETADEVIFVGYRFPPTDTIAKQRLIGAFRGIRKKSDEFQVKIVLGPEESNADIRRIKAMIETYVKRSVNDKNWEATVVPMWSQDFLALY